MGECLICGVLPTERCHVKDKAVLLKAGERQHDFQNIVHLCAYHHELFDNKQIAICSARNEFFVLTLISSRKIERVRAKGLIYVKPEFITWKNEDCHIYLQADLRKYCC